MAYNNNIPSYHDLRALSIVWLRAIALAWEYQQQEYNNDPKAQRFLRLLQANARQALAEYFNYQCPFSVNLIGFESDSNNSQLVQWISTQAQVDPTANTRTVTPGHWKNLPPNKIIFHLPTKPTSTGAPPTSPTPMGDEAIALAAYADSGSNYLFSCC